MSDAINAPAADAATAARFQKFGFQPVASQCVGCGHIRLSDGVAYCNSYANPAAKWSAGMCNFATHAKIEKKVDNKMINPLKASKRGGK
jgi:hypothetical protein